MLTLLPEHHLRALDELHQALVFRRQFLSLSKRGQRICCLARLQSGSTSISWAISASRQPSDVIAPIIWALSEP